MASKLRRLAPIGAAVFVLFCFFAFSFSSFGDDFTWRTDNEVYSSLYGFPGFEISSGGFWHYVSSPSLRFQDGQATSYDVSLSDSDLLQTTVIRFADISRTGNYVEYRVLGSAGTNVLNFRLFASNVYVPLSRLSGYAADDSAFYLQLLSGQKCSGSMIIEGVVPHYSFVVDSDDFDSDASVEDLRVMISTLTPVGVNYVSKTLSGNISADLTGSDNNVSPYAFLSRDLTDLTAVYELYDEHGVLLTYFPAASGSVFIKSYSLAFSVDVSQSTIKSVIFNEPIISESALQTGSRQDARLVSGSPGDDIDYMSSIAWSVGSILSIEIVPGVSISTVGLLVMSVGITLVFIKLLKG